MAEAAGTLHRKGAIEMQSDGENHLLRVDEAGTVTLGRDVLVEPVGEDFRLSSPHVPVWTIVGPQSVLHDEVARLIGR